MNTQHNRNFTVLTVQKVAAAALMSSGLAVLGLGFASGTAQAAPAGEVPQTFGHYCEWKNAVEEKIGEYGFLCHDDDQAPPPPPATDDTPSTPHDHDYTHPSEGPGTYVPPAHPRTPPPFAPKLGGQ
jgi:hypothetical protein